MNQSIQTGEHPDAERLNAFVEQALTPTEKERVLVHMARCGRCRQIIYLAQEAADRELAVSPSAPQTQSRPATQVRVTSPGAWLAGWRLAWIPTAALAGVVGFAVLWHARVNKPVEPQVASVTPSEQAPAGTLTKPPEVADQDRGAATATKKSESSTQRLKMRSEAAAQTTTAADALTQAPDGAVVSPGAPPARSDSYVPAISRLSQEKPATNAIAKDKAEQTKPSSEAAAAPVLNQAKIDPSFSAGSAALGGQIQRDARAQSILLPNGTTALSVAKVLGRTIALDPSGALYLTEDDTHWEFVAKQWTGRAIQLRTTKPSTKTAGAPISSGEAGTAADGSAFELVNDKMQTWTSADGRAWTLREPPSN